MINPLDYPLLVLAVSIVVLWLAAWVGATVLRKRRRLEEDGRQDYGIILTANLTLLGLILGFSFSMAISRYDQRRNYEEAEANAIGTEFVRADLLPAADAARLRSLLKAYIEQRILFYTSRDRQILVQINARTAQLQADLWSVVRASGTALPNPVIGLAVAGMNDVLNSQGYTQAAWWNRIPIAAWALMAAIAVFGNILIGYDTRRTRAEPILLLILPCLVGISFFLIADIDSPRGGVIRVLPQNLLSLAASLSTATEKP